MSTPVKVGVIGIGFMGSTHFRIHQAHPLAQVVAIADPDAQKVRGNWSAIKVNIGAVDNAVPVDLTGVAAYRDPLALIHDPAVELVDICAPTFLHRELVLAALAAGKHVLCEKPIARTTAEGREILAAARRAKGRLMIGMCIRFWPEYRYARELFRSGKLGRVKYACFKRVSPDISGNGWKDWFMKSDLSGGALLDLHLHDVDFVRHCFGRPKAVSAFGLKGFRSDKGYDQVVSRFDFGDGSLIVTEGGWAPAKGTPFEMSFLMVGEKGTVRYAADGLQVNWEDGRSERPSVGDPALPTGWHQEIDYYLRCLTAGKPPTDFMTIADVVDGIVMIEAEERSIGAKAAVTLKFK
jgi:predicted dehydrogenase